MARIKLKMKSPLVVSGKKLNNNYIESLPYISGDRVRAAFAKYILQNCPIYEVNKKEVVDTKQNKVKCNWVYYRNEESCDTCFFAKVCKTFSDIRFSFFYPQGTDVLPFTAMKCKYGSDHGFKDILIRSEILKCKKCACEKSNDGRMEAAYGFRNINKVFDVEKVMYTRNSINKYTKTSKESALYSIAAVKNEYFVGEIKGIDELLKVMKTIEGSKFIRIGSYISVGMGLFEIEDVKEENSQDSELIKKLNEFNERLREEDLDNEFDRNYNYIPILFKSDTKLGFEKENINGYLSDDEYRQIWKRAFSKDIKFDFEVDKVYTETEYYRGYDLSRDINDTKEAVVVLNKMGTTILLKTKENLKDLIEQLNKLERLGIGFETENGFGEIEICNELHLKGEIYE